MTRNRVVVKITMLMMTATILVGASFEAKAQQVIKEKAYQISIPAGWEQTNQVPQGIDVGFRKRLPDGEYATLYFHHEFMPPEAGEPPADTSDMKRQWDAMVRNQYPDMRPLNAVYPKVDGRILVNGIYELTDSGVKVRRRYTYFLAGRTAFVVQCSAPPSQWPTVLNEFDSILASLNPGGSIPKTEVKSDDSAKAELKRNLPTLLASFLSQWACSLSDVSISPTKRTLEIRLAFNRSDIKDIYKATKLLFGMIKAGKSDADLNSIPSELRSPASQSSEFIKYVGQVWGLASGYVANCNPAIKQYEVSILDGNKQKIGSVSISREDGFAILTGKVTASKGKRVAGMYVFE